MLSNHIKLFVAASILTLASPAYCRVVPEIRDFLDEETGFIGNAVVDNEAGLSAAGKKFRFEVFALRLRGLVGFDAANSINVTLVPEVELFFEREPEKKP
jgi:hypothetical protein